MYGESRLIERVKAERLPRQQSPMEILEVILELLLWSWLRDDEGENRWRAAVALLVIVVIGATLYIWLHR